MSVHFGYSIIYVSDVVATVAFYENAFGLHQKFLHESKLYAEMNTGQTILAFASEAMADLNGLAIRANRKTDVAAGFEIALICSCPQEVYQKALLAGALAVKPPEFKPWGQEVGYVRDINGCLVELCSAMSS